LSACAPMVSQSGLYWGNYSHTLYNLKNKPSDETRAKHIAELHSIIQKSKELNLRVPPGVYAELGMYTMEDGKSEQAKEYIKLELATYPESSAMVNQVLKKK
jgi:hypothetical protein